MGKGGTQHESAPYKQIGVTVMSAKDEESVPKKDAAFEVLKNRVISLTGQVAGLKKDVLKIEEILRRTTSL